jgi:hypothetical protein
MRTLPWTSLPTRFWTPRLPFHAETPIFAASRPQKRLKPVWCTMCVV